MELTQRWLVNRKVMAADGEIATKYVFPFWNREWQVVLTLLDRFGAPPEILHAPVRIGRSATLDTGAKRSDAKAVAVLEPGIFRELFHYDPWWVFRGIGGVPQELKDEILETNINHPFKVGHETWKVHDVEFEPAGDRVKALVAKDHVFKVRKFAPGELDLDKTWP